MNLSRRHFLAQSTLSIAALTLGACATAPKHPQSGPDAVVDGSFAGKAGTLVEGRPTFKTIQAALDATPVFGDRWEILVRRGRYHEKLTVTGSGVHLIGEDRDQTILTYDAYAGQERTDGVGTWKTPGSATLTITGHDFHASDLTIENAFDWVSNDTHDRKGPEYLHNPQAVAVYTSENADRTLFRNVRIQAYQDTLFHDAGRAFFDRCIIAGNVDFIFGKGQGWFDSCEIVTRPVGRKTDKIGYLTAASTSVDDKFGFVFNKCRLTRETPSIPTDSTALGRPWHPSGDPQAVAAVVFMECWMDDHIETDGWTSMSSTNKSGQRVTFTPEQSRFFEYKSTGPGARINAHRPQLSEVQASIYSMQKVLNGWKP